MCVCVGVKLRECGTREGIEKRVGTRGVTKWKKNKKIECLGRPTGWRLLKVGHCYPRTEPQGGLFRALFPAFGGTPLTNPREVRASAQPTLGPAALRWAAEPLYSSPQDATQRRHAGPSTQP